MNFYIEDDIIKKINHQVKRPTKGEVIYHENDKCETVTLVIKGEVEATQGFSDGHNKIIRTIKKGDVIGLSLIFSSNPSYKASFTITTKTSKLIVIKKEDLMNLMLSNQMINERILKYISDYSIFQSEHIKLLSCKFIRKKICSYLYNEYRTRNKLEFEIDYSKTDLSAFLNAERPSLSTEISRLCKEGIIENSNRKYKILDLDKLELEM